MFSPNLKLYPSWDTQKSLIPPRSRLYHLEPIGIETPYVESLTGYISRLAIEHCITPRKLILAEIAPLIDRKTKLSNSPIESISKVLGTERNRTVTNGIGLMATNLVRAISALTLRSDLHFLTLLPWAPFLSIRGLLRRKRAWCPICYQEWRDKEKSIYEPLIWYIDAVKICPVHYTLLLEECPQCHLQQIVLSGDSIPGYCNKCGHWLGSYKHKLISNKSAEITWQLYVVNNLGELLSSAPSSKSALNPNIISNQISTYINQFFQSNKSSFSRLIGIHKTTIASWCDSSAIPQINNLLLLSHFCGIKLLDFLTSEVLIDNFNTNNLEPKLSSVNQTRKSYKKLDYERKEVLNTVLNEVINEYPPPSLESVALRLRYSPDVLQYHFPEICQIIKVRHADYKKVKPQQKIKPVLEAALQELPPPSLLEITRRLGYKNSSYLYRYFPELSFAISKNYRQHCKKNGSEKRERIHQEIQNIAQLLHSQGYKPTRRRVASHLTSPGVMRNSYARSCLSEIQHSLGYD
jgi:hypothetical protein